LEEARIFSTDEALRGRMPPMQPHQIEGAMWLIHQQLDDTDACLHLVAGGGTLISMKNCFFIEYARELRIFRLR